MQPKAILETVLYAADLDAAERFYRDVLGLTVHAKLAGRHVFFRCAGQMLLIFAAAETIKPPKPDAVVPMLPHGAVGPGHLCFAAEAAEIAAWRERLTAAGVAIELEYVWPGGGKSIYFRDPAGNVLEFAEPRIWGL